MPKRSKRYLKLKDSIEANKIYSLEEAVVTVKEHSPKFDSTIELHLKLGIDASKSDQSVRGSVALPHGTGKTVRIMAFVNSNQESDAKTAGADVIGTDEVIAEIKKTGKVDFDVAIATPDMMKKIGPIARVLGQKGLMPNPKTETVGKDIKEMIAALKKGKVNFKNDDTGNIHLAVGKASFTKEQLIANIASSLADIKKAKPSASKGTFLIKGYLSSSMGPSLPIVVE